MKPTRNELSFDIEKRLHQEAVKGLKIREDWCKSRRFAAVAVDSSGQLKELQNNLISALRQLKSEVLIAMVLETLRNNEISPRAFSPELENLTQIDYEFGPFDWALTDSNLSFILLLTHGEYVAAAGPKSFLETLCGTTIVQARENFIRIANDSSEAEISMENLRRQGKESLRAAMEADVKRNQQRLLEVAAYYEKISAE